MQKSVKSQGTPLGAEKAPCTTDIQIIDTRLSPLEVAQWQQIQQGSFTAKSGAVLGKSARADVGRFITGMKVSKTAESCAHFQLLTFHSSEKYPLINRRQFISEITLLFTGACAKIGRK